jgi:hypothetical protein
MAVFRVAPCTLVVYSDVPEVIAASIIVLMMEAASTYETSVTLYQITRCQ